MQTRIYFYRSLLSTFIVIILVFCNILSISSEVGSDSEYKLDELKKYDFNAEPGKYTMLIENHGVRAAEIYLNGELILTINDYNQNSATLRIIVSLLDHNILDIKKNSRSSSYLIINFTLISFNSSDDEIENIYTNNENTNYFDDISTQNQNIHTLTEDENVTESQGILIENENVIQSENIHTENVIDNHDIPDVNCTDLTGLNEYIVMNDIVLCPKIYTMSDFNENGAIIFGTNDVTLDCNGATIFGGAILLNNSETIGIFAEEKTNIKVKNCNVQNYTYGLKFDSVSAAEIEDSWFTYNPFGVQISSATASEPKDWSKGDISPAVVPPPSPIKISNNRITSDVSYVAWNDVFIGFWDIHDGKSAGPGTTRKTNTALTLINGAFEIVDNIIGHSYVGANVAGLSSSTFANNTFIEYDSGIWANNIVYSNIYNNVFLEPFFGNPEAIYLYNSHRNNFNNNDLSLSSAYENNFHLSNSNYNTILNNELTKGGLSVSDSYNNIIRYNNISARPNGWGLVLLVGVPGGETHHNIIAHNNIFGNYVGIEFLSYPYLQPPGSIHSNIFYGNNFFNNSIAVGGVLEWFNCWNESSYGNYWSDYSGEDLDNDGIGDTPYVINGLNIDYLPLMKPA